MSFYALAFKSMKLLRLLRKAKSTAWPEGEAWRVKQSMLDKYTDLMM